MAQSIFAQPEQSTQQMYTEAYNQAGLKEIIDRKNSLLEEVDKLRDDLNTKIGAIDDNPWLSEASRVGRSKRLQELAQGDISNRLALVQDLEDTYDAEDTKAYISQFCSDPLKIDLDYIKPYILFCCIGFNQYQCFLLHTIPPYVQT